MAIYNVSYPGSSNYKLQLEVYEHDPSIPNNNSLVDAYLYMVVNNASAGYFNKYNHSSGFIINGTTYSNSSTTFDGRSTGKKLLYSKKDITIPHNSDGSKTISVSAWHNTGVGLGNGSLSGTMTLTTINRQATVTSATDFTDEGNPTITYTNPGGFKINARLEFLGINIRRDNISNTGSYTFDLTDEERDLLRQKCTGNSMTVREVIATCISGDDETYWSWQDKTLTIINANPTFSNFTVQDSNDSTYALTGDRSKFIKLYSNALVTISKANKMVAKKQASAVKYLVASGSKSATITYSDTEDVSTTINNVDTALMNVNAVDSRTLQTSASKVLDMIDYSEPNITTFDMHRVDGSGTNAIFTMKGTYSDIDFGAVQNTLVALKVRYKKSTETSYSEWTDITSMLQYNAGIFSVENATITDITFDLGTTYDVQIIITDKLSETVQQGSINDGTVLMAVSKGNGVAFGGVYDVNEGGAVQINGKAILEYEVIEEW